jgi:zinc protease
MKRSLWAITLCAAVAAVGGPRLAGGKPAAEGAASAATSDPRIAFERYQLANGLEVILHQDNALPLVAVDIWYHVGSGNERPGKSGFAHLFEHMLFQGAKHIGEDAHFETLKKVGGSSVNGTTNSDRTNYFEVVPSHQLETALWLESDRMGYLLPMLNQQSLDNQIDVVRNERRQSVDNAPYGASRLAVAAALYPEGHPYRYMVIGRHEDLASASLTDVRNFYKTWYVPANATLTLAGDFEMDTAKALVAKWFGSFPPTRKPTTIPPPFPALTKTVRKTVEDPFAKLRMVDYAWHSPAFFGEGDAELDILADALGASGTGRLYRTLVHEKQLAQHVFAYQASTQFSSTFHVGALLKSDADLATVEAIIQDELQNVLKVPIDDKEFRRAVVSQEARFVWQLEDLLARAELLQRYNHYVGKPDYITEDLNRYRNSSPARVQKVAANVLSKPRVEVITNPIEGGK